MMCQLIGPTQNPRFSAYNLTGQQYCLVSNPVKNSKIDWKIANLAFLKTMILATTGIKKTLFGNCIFFPNSSRCLKIPKKSPILQHCIESYICIIENAKNGQFGEFLKNWRLRLSSVIRSDRSILVGQKLENSIWNILAFWSNFCPIKWTCLVTRFDHKLQFFKKPPQLTVFGIF